MECALMREAICRCTYLAWWLQFDSHPRQLLEISYGVELLMALVNELLTSFLCNVILSPAISSAQA